MSEKMRQFNNVVEVPNQDGVENIENNDSSDSNNENDNKQELKSVESLYLSVEESEKFEELIEQLSDGDSYGAREIAETFFQNHSEVLESKEVFAAAKEGLINEISNGRIGNAEEIARIFLQNHPEEVVSAARKALIKEFSHGSMDIAKVIAETFLQNYPEKVIPVAREWLIKGFSTERINRIKKISETFLQNHPEVLESSEVISAAKKLLIEELSYGNIYEVGIIAETFLQNHPEALESKEVISAAKKGLISSIFSSNIDNSKIIAENYLQDYPELLKSEEVISAAKDALVKGFSDGILYNSKVIAETFLQNYPEEVIPVAREWLIKGFSMRHIDHAKKIAEIFFQDHPEELVSAAKDGLIEKLSSGDDSHTAKEIAETFLRDHIEILESEEAISAAKQGLIKKLSSGDVYSSRAIIRTFFQKHWKEAEDAAISVIVSILENEQKIEDLIDNVEQIRDFVYVQSEKLEECLYRLVVKQLKDGDIDSAKKIKRGLNISIDNLELFLWNQVSDGILGELCDVSRKDFVEIFGEMVEDELEENLTYVENVQNYISNLFEVKNAQNSEEMKKSIEQLDGEEKYEHVFENLRKMKLSQWDAVGDEFAQMAEAFGYEAMFEMVGRGSREVALPTIAEAVDYFSETLDQFNSPQQAIVDLLTNKLEPIKILEKNGVEGIIKIKKAFTLSPELFNDAETQHALHQAFMMQLAQKNNQSAFALLKEFPIKLSQYEQKAVDIFGEFLTYDILLEIQELENGKIGEELRKIGVTRSGHGGLLELTDKTRELREKFSGHNVEQIQFEDSEFQTNYFLSYVNYKGSSWGESSAESFLSLYKMVKNREFEPLTDGFELVETYQVGKKAKQEKVDKSLYQKDFLVKFPLVLRNIEKAKSLFEDEQISKKPLSAIAEEFKIQKDGVIAELKNKVEELQDNPKAQIGLRNRISLLEKIDIRSIKDFQENFKMLSQFNQFSDLLQQALFVFAFAQNKAYLDKDWEMGANPSVDDISSVVDFVGHIVNQETMAKYFTDKQATKKFEKMVDVSILKNQMNILQNGQKTSGITNLTFSTHRDLHTEISGQVGDACWASKYNSILESYPNLSSILMVRDKGGKYERVIGSSLLIETKAENGDDLLIVRGLNPQETPINRLDVGEFFASVVDYVKKLAQATGKKAAISIDDHSGGHATNREVLFNYIVELKDSLANVRLLDSVESTFNGYDLQGDVYLLEKFAQFDNGDIV